MSSIKKLYAAAFTKRKASRTMLDSVPCKGVDASGARAFCYIVSISKTGLAFYVEGSPFTFGQNLEIHLELAKNTAVMKGKIVSQALLWDGKSGGRDSIIKYAMKFDADVDGDLVKSVVESENWSEMKMKREA